MEERHAAIVLAAGKGVRLGGQIPKQYLPVNGKPILAYSLQVFEECPFIDEVVLVTGAGDEDWCRHEIAERYGFRKVRKIVPGGAERYFSVYEGLRALEGSACTYVYIHDGARPFPDQAMLARLRDDVRRYGACVAAMPSKDTVKIADGEGFAAETPRRSLVWSVQTPQVFSCPLILDAYRRLARDGRSDVTDDAMVLECMTGHRVRLTEGSYRNIKVTTAEDLAIAEIFAKHP